uniref:4Fe-4S dicluster domain-containing protein n=1 Tax=Geoglobus ahangari TaxID=113653 RepID=A0A7C4W372_9EURY
MLLELIYDSKVVKEPILTRVAIEENTLLNIIEAKVSAREGKIVVELEDEIADRIERKFTEYGVKVRRLERGVEKKDTCVDCGACISICPVGVFSFDKEFRLVADSSKCMRCGTCVTICPVKALSLPE